MREKQFWCAYKQRSSVSFSSPSSRVKPFPSSQMARTPVYSSRFSILA